MEAAVIRALAQRSKLKNLAPLKTLCVETIIENLQYFEGKQQLFSSLPSTVLDFILVYGDYAPAELIEIAAQNQTEKLMLDFSEEGELSEDDVLPLCQLVKEKCQNLQGLRLFWDGDENEETYCTLLSSLPHLRELRLDNVSDRILDSITSTKLRSLELDLGNNSPGLSTEKLCQLIQNCPELEKLVADRLDASNNIVRQALLSLRKLSIIRCKGMEKFVEKALAEHQKLQQKEIGLKSSNFQSGLPIPNLSETLPCLQTLNLHGFSDVGPFLNFEHVTKLQLAAMPWKLLIHTYGSKLTSLEIFGCVDAIDLSMIGYLCTDLENLFVENTSINQHCAYKLGQEHFSSLKTVHLTRPSHDVEYTVDGNVMYRILSAPKLSFFFSEFIKLPNTLLCQLIAEAEEKGVVFSEMEGFDTPATDMSVETAIKLICAMPKLEDVSFFRMSEANLDIVGHFVAENLLEVNL